MMRIAFAPAISAVFAVPAAAMKQSVPTNLEAILKPTRMLSLGKTF
jgi:hypothetical protein